MMTALLTVRTDTAATHRIALIVAAPLVAAMLALATTPAWSLELAAVLENTTVTPPARVGFREERHNPMLKEPLVLTGYLEYLEAGRLRKVIETPFEEAFLIEADQILIERDGETRRLPLKKSKSLQTILGAIEAILAGDTRRLEETFDHELTSADAVWSVALTPTSRRIARHLKGLRVTGDERSLMSIRVELRDGEWHRMEILRNATQP